MKQDYTIASLFWLLIFSFLASSTVYHYGTGNHAVIVPFLKFVANGNLYPGDYFIAQQQYYHTYLWDLYAWVMNTTGLSVEVLFFASYLIVMFLSAVAIFGIAKVLFDRTDVAFLAVFIQLFYFIHNAGLGDEFLMDNLYKESQAALPLLLFAIYFFFKEQFKVSYLLQGLAFLIHPLTAIYVVALLGVPFLWISYKRGWKTLIMPLSIFVLMALPLVVRKLSSTPETMHMFTLYQDWAEMLRIRYAGHSFPFSWSIWKYVKAAFVVALFLYSWRCPARDDKHQLVKIMTFTTFSLWFLAVIFTEVIPLPVFIQFQFFRSYAFLSLFAVIYWANFLMVNLQNETPIWRKAVYLLATIGLIVYLPSEGSPVIEQIAASPGVLWKNSYVYIILSGACLIGYYWKFQKSLPSLAFASLLLLISLFFYGRKLQKSGIFIQSKQPTAWVDLQNWAKNNSNIDDAFIVPPDQRGFRVDGERTIYADYKDGIQMYFNPEFGYQWMERMQALGNPFNPIEAELKDNYLGLHEADFHSINQQISDDHGTVYLVTFAEGHDLNFDQVYQNDTYVVYRMP